jgi:hypothetical protein
MTLPKIDNWLPTKKITLPISGAIITIRAFSVREEKLFLMMKEGSTPQEIFRISVDAMTNCTFGKLECSTIPIADLEYTFLQTRTISKGETQDVYFTCNNRVIDPESPEGEKKFVQCGTKVKHSIDLTSVQTTALDGYTRDIRIGKTPLVIRMRNPTVEHIIRSMDAANSDDSVIKMFKDLVEQVMDTDKGINFDDFTREDLDVFFDSLPQTTFDSILEDYWLKYPQLRHLIKFNCPVCGHKEDIQFTGLSDFFT